jgi:hypothetical protein
VTRHVICPALHCLLRDEVSSGLSPLCQDPEYEQEEGRRAVVPNKRLNATGPFITLIPEPVTKVNCLYVPYSTKLEYVTNERLADPLAPLGT